MKLKIFFIALFLSLPLWWAINTLNQRLELGFLEKLSENNITANVSEPIIEKDIPVPDFTARSVLSITLDGKVLFQKNPDEKLPIASLTKLITALVVLDNYDISLPLTFTKLSVVGVEDPGGFKVGQVFYAKDLLYSLLMESSNDSALALSEVVGQKAFVDLMNLEIKDIALNTSFFNVDGVDRKDSNYSTARDLFEILKYLIKDYPLIFEITSKKEYDLYSPDNVFHHKIINRNELLGKIPGIYGGKTGETEKAKQCLIVVLKKNNNYLINIILGSDDRFSEMEKLINWEKESNKW